MQKLIIKNFRQIPYAEIDITKFTIFIGSQASGKSTIAKLIYFFKSLKQDYFDVIYTNPEKTDLDLQKLFIKTIQDKFNLYFGFSTELSQDFELEYHFSTDNNKFVRLYRHKSLSISFEPSYFKLIVSQTKEIANRLRQYSQVSPDKFINHSFRLKEQEQLIFDLHKTINGLFFDEKDAMFIPDNRNITVSYSELFKNYFAEEISKVQGTESKGIDSVLLKNFIRYSAFLNDRFRNKSIGIDKSGRQKISAFLNLKSKFILNAQYENIDGIENIVFGNKTYDSLPLSLASSGQRESIRILQDIFYTMEDIYGYFRIYEEPEAHLFPEAQKHLIELMALMANKTDSQVVITTHSPYILTVINDLLYYSKVVESNPESKENIEKHFGTYLLDASQNERINLLKEEVRVYSLGEPEKEYCEQVVDDSGMISENYLDNTSEQIQADFEFLYSNHKTKIEW